MGVTFAPPGHRMTLDGQEYVSIARREELGFDPMTCGCTMAVFRSFFVYSNNRSVEERSVRKYPVWKILWERGMYTSFTEEASKHPYLLCFFRFSEEFVTTGVC